MKPTGPLSILSKAVLSGGVAMGALLLALPQAAAEVGVTAAVNVDAKGQPPGGAPRVLALGNNIVFNEKITTDAQGLVQVLLLDGTTFTVGPNSQLTIDEFVYNPETGDAKVVASLTKGVFRFVGARTSQTEGGATVKTPVGTIGIRGAVSNISYNPASGETTAALVAGKSLNITDSDGTTRIVYETGYTAVVTKTEGGGTTTTVRKSTAAETGVFQQQITSKPGQNGGTTTPPTNETVENSGVGETNSDLPDNMTVPGSPKPVQSSEPGQEEDVAGTDGAAQDDINNEIDQQPNARLLLAPGTYNSFFGGSFPDAGDRGLVGSTPETDQLVTLTSQGGRLVSANGDLNLPDYTGTDGDGAFAPLAEFELCDDYCGEETASYQGNPLSGKAYAGRGDFAVYLLDMNDGGPADPVYVISGTPTPEGVLNSMESGFQVREYTLTEDPIQNRFADVPVPFFNNDLYQGSFEAGSYNSSNMFVIEPGESTTADIRTFQSWISIEGEGPGQKSAAFVNTANGYRNEDGELALDSGRRGSFRDSATSSATNMRGGIASIPGASGAHFFGPNADHFVIGTSIDPADTFFDSNHGGAFDPEVNTGYLADGNFATHHVANLINETPQGEALSNGGTALINGGLDGRLDGYMAGMGETDYFGNTYRLSSGNQGPNMYVDFNAVDNAFAARGTVYDNNEDDYDSGNYADRLQSMLLTFGHYTDELNDIEHPGQGTYIDDTYYGAGANNDLSETVVTTDDGLSHTDDDQYAAGSYIVSGRANPIEGYQHLEGCSECAFIQWGWWGTRTQTDLEGDDDDIRTDYVHMGTWVAGEITDPSDLNLPTSGDVTFVGTALGTVERGGNQYIASGNVTIDYNFDYRQGDLAITNFDGMDASGFMSDASSPSQLLFGGSLSGTDTVGEVGLSGNATGALVNDGPNVAAGALGNFSFGGVGVSAVGTFAGSIPDF